jgi:undecaprenyl-diphosphatase
MNSLQTLDRSLFLFINSLNSTWLNPVMNFVSGQFIWILPITIIVCQAWNKWDRKKAIIFIVFCFLVIIVSDATASYLLKNIFERLRPCRLPELKEQINSFGQKCGGKYGFVSSHASNSLSLVLFSFLSLKLEYKKFSWLLLLPLFVGWSRIYLGVHYPGDILGGYLVGTVWAVLFALIFNHTSMGPIEGGSKKIFV